jgi:hypothetical protein
MIVPKQAILLGHTACMERRKGYNKFSPENMEGRGHFVDQV